VPLLVKVWGRTWFERGCLSAHYQNMVVEGEEVKASIACPAPGVTTTKAWAHKADGTAVLEASASIGPNQGTTLLEARLAQLRPPERLVILADLRVGMKGAQDERVRMDFDQHMGDLYPFSLKQKLSRITENSPWYSDASSTPWGRCVIPLEMVSVLAEYSGGLAKFPIKGPAVGLFADQEIRMVDGPLFVGEDYVIRREIIAISESKRTESFWMKTRIYDASGTVLKAEVLLNHASVKDSYAGYAEARASL
jgi:hypothetical protein